MNIDGKKITSFGSAVNFLFNKIAEIPIGVFIKTTAILCVVILFVLGFNISINRSEREILLTHIVNVMPKDEKEDLNIRDMVSPKIQKRLNALVYTLNCDRAFVIELHNGKKNATELPFKYFDMTYEEVNETRHIKHVSQHFVDVMTTHYKLPYYLASNAKFCGYVSDLEKIDKRFAANFEEQRGAYIAMVTLRVNGEEIGFLGIAYESGTQIIDEEKIIKALEYERNVIKDLLDLGAQKDIVEKGKGK